MQRQSRIDRMFDEIIVDACRYDEQLWAFQAVLDEDIACPVDAFVLGEPVEVAKVDYDGNERRGITATCRKNKTEWVVSVADVVFAAGSPAADLVDAYRKLLGLKPVGGTRAGEKMHKAEVAEIAIGEAVDVAILAAKGRTTRVRLLESGRQLTLRKGLWAVPGEIATVMPKRVWSFNGHPYMAGDVTDVRLEVPALGLTPLRLEAMGDWDPEELSRGDSDEPPENWARPICDAGPRPAFAMEQIVPGDSVALTEDGVEMMSDGPILEAIDARRAGDGAGAHEILGRLLIQDLRCLDAHAHLALFTLDFSADEALRHYTVGVEIGQLSLGADFNGVLPWGWIDNRPFLRCLHGLGLCLWRLDRIDEARSVFDRLLWLNPGDNQGVRFPLADLDAGKSWEESVEGEGPGRS